MLGHENVRRLNIAMNDALGVRGLECVGNLHPQIEKPALRQRLAGDKVLKGAALHQLHRQERLSLHLVDLIERANVGMIERRGGLGLPLESRHRHGFVR